jgi:hypothetical protein
MSQAALGPICWHCGAPNDAGSSQCWLCQRRNWRGIPSFRTRFSPPLDLPRRGPMSTIRGQMLVIAAIAVALAIVVLVPPMAIALLISALPAYFITEIKAIKRRLRGDPMSAWVYAVTLVGFTILIPTVLAVALIALIIVCIQFLW